MHTKHHQIDQKITPGGVKCTKKLPFFLSSKIFFKKCSMNRNFPYITPGGVKWQKKLPFFFSSKIFFKKCSMNGNFPYITPGGVKWQTKCRFFSQVRYFSKSVIFAFWELKNYNNLI